MPSARPLLAGALLMGALSPVLAQAPLPSLAELEAAGARIGEVRVVPQNIFDLEDPRENNALFRLANRLHIRTRPELIRRSLLFEPGEPLSVRRIEETERLLRQNPYLYDVAIRPVEVRDGLVDIEVVTRDTWSLKPELSYGREGGVNEWSLSLEERNLFGTGRTLSITRISEIDRRGTEFLLSDRHAFDGWTTIDYAYSDLDTGHDHSLSVARPFYSLETREAAGLSLQDADQIAKDYRAGEIVSEYRHSRRLLDLFAGRSAGLVEGWTQRWSGGYQYQFDLYALDPERDPPARLPDNVELSGPYLRYEVLEDDFRKLQNFDLIERPEFFELGFHATAQLGRALTDFGSTRDSWVYSLGMSDGIVLPSDRILLLNGAWSGRHDERAHRRLLSGTTRFYARQSTHALFFASASGAYSRSPDIFDVLQLGGDNGLRGYPLRYQTGDKRLLFTVEQRLYTDYFPFRLFRVGGAVFYDVGRAWGGPFGQGEAEPGWLSDIGFGLRILSARSAFGNVIHADVAFPLVSGNNIKSAQFLLKSRTSF